MSAGAYDLVIVGGGPAGAAAGVVATMLRPDARVAVVDRARFPRDKTCGDALSPEAVAELGRLGAGDVTAGYKPAERMRIRSARGVEVAANLHVAGYVVPRQVLDARLLAHATGRGAELIHARVRDVAQHDGGVTVATSAGTLRARAVIGADGANSTVRRRLGMVSNPERHAAVAIRVYAPAPPGPPELLLQWVPGTGLAYAWSFPVDGSTANLGFGTLSPEAQGGKPALLARLSEQLPHASAADPSAVRGHRLPLATFRPPPGRGRVLLAGDAASLINPVTGEGIFYALLSGRLAATAILETPDAPLRAYRSALRAALGRHLRHNALMAWALRYPGLIDGALRAAARSPAAREALADVVFGDGALTTRRTLQLGRGVLTGRHPFTT